MEKTFKEYQRIQKAEMRPVTKADMEEYYSTGMIAINTQYKVSIGDADKSIGCPKIGDMIARNPVKPNTDQWLVERDYFKDNFATASAASSTLEWVNDKPDFNKECILLTHTFYGGTNDYASWLILKIDGEDGWYWGLCNIDREEWGPLEDLAADHYCIVNEYSPSPALPQDQKGDGWVRVEDEEAPEHENVLVKIGDDTILIGIYNEQKQWAIYYKDGCYGESSDRPVTHWMPLPAPPNK